MLATSRFPLRRFSSSGGILERQTLSLAPFIPLTIPPLSAGAPSHPLFSSGNKG